MGEKAFERGLNDCSSGTSAVPDGRTRGGSVRGDRALPAALLLLRSSPLQTHAGEPGGSRPRDYFRAGFAISLGPPSEIIGRNHFPPGPRHQPGEDANSQVGLQEVYRAVRERGVGPAGVEAIDLPVVGAIDGARPVEG